MRSLSIIIPTHNGIAHLKRCLPSVVRHAPSNCQIIVVDDASTDDSCDWIRNHFPSIELIELSKNLGFCQAINVGLQYATGEIIELLNNDTEVCEGWADACLVHFEDPTIGSVAPLVLSMDAPGRIDSSGQNYHICGWAFNRGFGRSIEGKYLKSCEVFGPSGSSGFYRRAALEKTGGLLPEYGAYFEDTDLAFRLRWAGYRCQYEPKARVFHRGSGSYHQASDRVIQLISRNEELAYWINLPLKDLIKGLFPHLGFLTVRIVKKLISGGLGPFLKGKLEAAQSWDKIVKRRKEVHQLVNGHPINLSLSKSGDVLQKGLVWLKDRKCA